MSGFDLDASVEMALDLNLTPEQAAEIDRVCMEFSVATGESKERLINRVASLIRQLPKPCALCGGSGVIQGRPTTYETDSREEMALAWEIARYPCPECAK